MEKCKMYMLPFVVGIVITSFVLLETKNNYMMDAKASLIPLQNDNWTIMVYMDGDNDLESAVIDDFLEMSSVGSSNKVNIVVQMDRTPGWRDSNGQWHDNTSYGNWTGTMRFYVTRNMTPTPQNASQDLGELNMGDPRTLVDFVRWAIGNYSAQHYAVILWNHGGGLGGVCFDDTSNQDGIEVSELKTALSAIYENTSVLPDLIDFSACLMQLIEVSYAIANYTDYVVGSEEEMSTDTLPFNTILNDLINNPNMSSEQFGIEIVDEFGKTPIGRFDTQSCLRANEIQNLTSNIDAFARRLLYILPTHYRQIRAVRKSTQHFEVADYIDLYHFAQLINRNISDASVKLSARNVMDAINNTVVRNFAGSNHPNAHGISIFFPSKWGWYIRPPFYGNKYDFTRDTYWDEFLTRYLKRLYVNVRNTGSEDGTIEHPYNTIQEAVDAAEDGFTIYVFNGTYCENIVVNKSVTIIGNSSSDTSIDGKNGNAIMITANNVTIKGFTIFNVSNGITASSNTNITIENCDIYGNGIGISFSGSSNSTIRNCNIYSNWCGVFLGISSYNTFDNCKIYSNSYVGVYLFYLSNNNTIQNCNVSKNNYGIYMYNSSFNLLPYNTIYSNYYGIYLYNSTSNSIGCSPVHSNTYGVYLFNSNSNCIGSTEWAYIYDNMVGIYIYKSSNNDITRLYVNSNDKYGIYLENSSGNNITSCTIYEQENSIFFNHSNNNLIDKSKIHHSSNYSIYLYNSRNNTIRKTKIYNNSYAIKLLSSDANVIIDSDIYNNSYAIHVCASGDSIIDECDISSNNNSINFYSCTNTSLQNSNIYNNSEGISICSSSYNSISDCNISRNNIVINGSTHNTIYNCDIIFNTQYGIYLYNNSDYNEINSCNIYNNSNYAIVIWNSSYNKIKSSNIFNNPRGILISTSKNNSIIYSSIYDNIHAGIEAWQLSNSSIINCSIYRDGDHGLFLYNSSNNCVRNSSIYSNTYGISLYFSSKNGIQSCNISNNAYGICNYNSSDMKINGCNISNNFLYGIHAFNPWDSLINWNNIVGNGFGIYNDNFPDLHAEYNWWGDASGPSGAASGSGDAVSNYVSYEPWLGAAITASMYKEIAAGKNTITVMNTEITINSSGKTTITVTKYKSNPGKKMSNGLKALGNYIDIYIDDESVIKWPIFIKIYYTQNDLNKANLKENQLVGIFYWNETSKNWELYNETGVNTTDINNYAGYLWANAYHLTPLASGADIAPPEISDVGINLHINFVNITCKVVDNYGIESVSINVTAPDGETNNATMENIGTDYFYFNHSYLKIGTYHYYIWAIDVSGNGNISTVYTFNITPPSVVYVDDDFNSSTPGWQYNAFNSIQEGIDAVANGGIVYVYNGTYYENVVINKTIDVIGNDAIIDGMRGNGIWIKENSTLISNFVIKNCSIGLYIKGLFVIHNVSILNNTIYENIYGIGLETVNESSVVNNVIYNNSLWGIYMISSNSNNIKLNEIYNHTQAWNSVGIVMFSSSNYNNISLNTVYNNGIDNIEIWNNSFYNEIWNNTVYNAIYGILLSRYSNNNTISMNTIYDNDYGIGLGHQNVSWGGIASNNVISSNYIYNNSVDGIHILSSSGNIILNNMIKNNGNGIWLYNSTNNIIYNNYFENIQNAYDNGNNLWNITKTAGINIIGGSYIAGNYWHDYNGVDTNGDGIGNTLLPYDCNGNIENGDMQPLTEANYAPIANFTWIPSVPTTTNATQFISLSFDIDGEIVFWQWEFGDGETSNEENPLHQYVKEGVYIVNLTVWDDIGAMASISKNITVIKPSIDYIAITFETRNEIPDYNISTNISFIAYASAFNYTYGFIEFINVNWSLVNYGSNASINASYGKSIEFYSGKNDGIAILYAENGTYNDSVILNINSSLFTFLLKQGWNFITLPCVNDYYTSTLFQNISGCKIILIWNTSLKNFDIYVPGCPYDYDIEDGKGYFVAVEYSTFFALEDLPIESIAIHLYIGWNTIGWINSTPILASSLYNEIVGSIILLKWNATLQDFMLYIPQAPDFYIYRGEGILIAVNEESIWYGEG